MINIDRHAKGIRIRRRRVVRLGGGGAIGGAGMIVCHCNVVSDRTVGAIVAAGATTLDEVAELCGAGSDCGGCHRRLERLLDAAERLLDAAA